MSSKVVNKNNNNNVLLSQGSRSSPQKKEKIQKKMQMSSLLFGDINYSIPCASYLVLHKDNLKNRMNCTRMIWRKGWINPILQNRPSALCKLASAARNYINFVTQTAATTFCIYPSSLVIHPPNIFALFLQYCTAVTTKLVGCPLTPPPLWRFESQAL